MERASDFDTFYQQLKPFLRSLDAPLKLQRRHLRATYYCFIAGIIFLLCSWLQVLGWSGWLCSALFGILTMLHGSLWWTHQRNFSRNYKSGIMKAILEFMDADLEYDEISLIVARDYQWSSLFRRRYDYFETRDAIRGNYKGVHFEACQLTTTGLSQGGGKHEIHFSGLFLKAAIHPNYQAGTYCWKTGQEQLAATVAEEIDRLYPMPDVHAFTLNDPHFHQYYSVYSTFSAEAAALLHHERRQHLLQFIRQTGNLPRFSFVAGTCYAAIPLEEDLLLLPEKDAGNPDPIRHSFYSVLLILSLLNALQLRDLQ